MRAALAAAALVCMCAPLACKKGAASLCSSNIQCAAGFLCNPATGACGCGSDAACAATEQCNAAGYCQPRLNCVSTADCDSDSICDSASGACIAGQTCTTDVQCAQGSVCDKSEFACEVGCRLTGDCPIGEVCRPCPAGTPAAQCKTGNQCVLGPCDAQRSCPYGDFCLPDSTGETFCTADPQNRPFCQPCARVPGSPEYCAGGNANYCLIDTSKPLGQAFYCGVDCSDQGQATCPNGYTCRDVRIVTATGCQTQQGLSACPGPAAQVVHCDPSKNHPPTGGSPGIVNDDCEAASPPLIGSVCDPNSGICVAQCIPGAESAVDAFCSCTRDDDCPQDACDSSTRACTISGKPCIVGQVPDQCQSTNRIFCVKVEDPRLGAIGYCRIGQNCAPAEGFTCDRLLSSGP